MIAQRLVDRAMATAQGAQVTSRQWESTSIAFENDRLKAAQNAQRTHVEVQVVVDGRLGSSSTTELDDLDGVVARALETAPFGSPVHFRYPGPQEAPDVLLYDDEVLSTTQADMVQIGDEIVALLKGYDPEILASAEIERGVGRVELANSSGAAFAVDSTDFGVSAGGVRVRGTDVLTAGHTLGGRARTLDHRGVAHKVIDWFRMAENLVAMNSGDLPVILTPAASSILILTLWLGLDGKNVLLGASPLAGRLGQPVAAPRFSLVDDPLIDFAPRSSRFDGEGVARRRTPLIEAGVVRNFLYDLDTAGRAGAQSSGHGPDRAPTNLVIPAGHTPYAQMLRGIDEGLLVHDVLGLGQGNPISGEFSINVQLGYKIEKGEIVGRVKDVMLAGNVYDALRDIVAIGSEPEWVVGEMVGLFPYIQLGHLSVVAG
jgi:PmbA protein